MVNKVIFEGIDGSGKTTLIKNLVETFSYNGVKALYVDEIGKSPVSEILKKMLSEDIFFRSSYEFNTSMFETLLLAADNHFRNQYIGNLVKKEKDLEYVFFDRDYISILVYQKGILERDHPKKTHEIIKNLEILLTFELPFEDDLTQYVYVNTPVDICLKRVQNRDKKKLNSEEISFLKDTKKEFDKYFLSKLSREKIHLIDGSLEPKYNSEKLFQKLTK
jgi:thymidylate kinase